MRGLRLRIVFELILGTVVIASLVVILRQWRRLAECTRHQEADAKSLRLLRGALKNQGKEVPVEVPEEESALADGRAAIAQREATIVRIDRELAESHAANADLQNQLSTVKDQDAAALAGAQQDLQKQQADAQAQLADLHRKLDAAVNESEIARQRAAALDTQNAKLQAASASATNSADTARILSNLQDLERRREGYLTSILRRYRDITNEFNAMSSMLDTSHPQSPAPFSGATLARIQNAVSSTEDDLRQINELNARSEQLLKQLPKK